MVVVTTFAVGWFANWLVPELTLGAALVLGAVVAPPDAVAAVAVGRKLGLPRRMMAILKGESLVNDAAALTLFALATAAVTGRKIAIGSPVLYFLYEVVGGVLVGLVLSFAVMPTAELSALVQRVQRVSEARANVDRAEEVSDYEAKALRANSTMRC